METKCPGCGSSLEFPEDGHACCKPYAMLFAANNVIKKCAETFREYEKIHAAKFNSSLAGHMSESDRQKTLEKARSNREMAELCESVLGESPERTYTESEVMQWTGFYHGCLDKHVNMPEKTLNVIWETWLKTL